MKQLETNRLILRKPNKKDLNDFHEYASMKNVGPTAGWLPHENIRESLIVLKHHIKTNDVWAIILKSENKMIGTIGLHINSFEEAILGITELGFSLNSNYWNKGITSEAVNVVIKHAFLDLEINKILAGHIKDNISSEKIIKKNNFKFTHNDDTRIFSNEDIKEVFMYELNREDYINENKI